MRPGRSKQFRDHAEAFDVVVTDLSMPPMSGFELTEEVHRVRGDTPVVLSSGYMEAEELQKAELLGVRETIPKPATANRLATILEKIFSEQPASIRSARR